MNRIQRITEAQKTLNAFKEGYYNSMGRIVEINVNPLEDKNLLIGEHDDITMKDATSKKFDVPANIYVMNAPVPDVFVFRNEKYGVLNFASAKNPGGGFLNGSLAQEESLCYASNLYNQLRKYDREYYGFNKSRKTHLYCDRMIYSHTIFIRDSSFNYLPITVEADVLSCPAVNLNAALKDGENERYCYRVMRERMRKILSVFSSMGNERIVLGAYGCGVFGNDPLLIAQIWKELLNEGWKYHFKEIIFAVYDTSAEQNTYRDFLKILA